MPKFVVERAVRAIETGRGLEQVDVHNAIADRINFLYQPYAMCQMCKAKRWLWRGGTQVSCPACTN